jgi:hypothetical protein
VRVARRVAEKQRYFGWREAFAKMARYFVEARVGGRWQRVGDEQEYYADQTAAAQRLREVSRVYGPCRLVIAVTIAVVRRKIGCSGVLPNAQPRGN